MEVILLEKVRNLGQLGDKVKVKSGFGRNFLIPEGKAVYATAANIAKFEARRAELEKVAAETKIKAQARADKLQDLVIKIQAKASEEGKLFGSIGTREISKALADVGHEIAKSEIELPQGAIRTLGEFPIHLQLHSDITVTINLLIVPEEAVA